MVKRIINFIIWIFSEQPTLARLSLNRAFQEAIQVTQFKPGKILEIGAGVFNSQIENLRARDLYLSLDLCLSNKPTLVGNACAIPLKNECMDTVILLEVLEHIQSPTLLITECMRVLKSGGVLIGSTRFIHSQHGAPDDYYRFTDSSIIMFFVNWSDCKIEKLGNKLCVLVDIITENYRIFRLFNCLLQYVRMKPTTCYSGLMFVAKK